MLQLENLRKSYTTANFTQNALDGVSVSFRENEFTAILGPSGSGKTTMLNIIGGLDQCDSGDLKIDNISTKKYKDRDWDTYRNNRIGFVFQSYNLIPHQSILSNVELALTLSGVSVAERREKAIQALTEVGLAKHIRKRPNQLSGGQMQRVAIARALVNDPEILLADEPTGAVDSETSLHIMDLLTKIAKDRLVIMVTHNNELAEKYANRIIHLKDGKIVSDSRPFTPDKDIEDSGREIRKSSMSFFTAISLSFSNLMTKKGRTFVTSLAGSIGIIGIATILALANGINLYIQRVEEETLSLYPLMIQTTGINLAGMFGGGGTPDERAARPELPPDYVRERRVMRSVFSAININDLESLKYYFEEENEIIHSHVTTIHYMYDITPQIFLADTSNGVIQVNPDEILTDAGAGPGGGGMGMGFFGMPAMQVFHELPNKLSLFVNQYEVLAGHWPENYDEAVLVLSHGGSITDFEIYAMGLRDRSELQAMIDSFMTGTEMDISLEGPGGVYSYDTLMGVEFKVINPADTFQFDEEFEVWVDRSNDSSFMRNLVDNGLTLRIVGIVRPDPNSSVAMLSQGINFTPELIAHLIKQAGQTEIVKNQLANPDVNVITGRPFADEMDDPGSTFDFSRIISVDEDIIAELFSFDFEDMEFNAEGLDLDISSFNFNAASFNFDPSIIDLDMSGFHFDASDLPPLDINILMNALSGITIPPVNIQAIYQDFIIIFQADPNNVFPPTNDVELTAFLEEFSQYLTFRLSTLIDPNVLGGQIQAALEAVIEEYMSLVMSTFTARLQGAMAYAMQRVMEQVMSEITRQMRRNMTRAMNDITTQIEDSIETMFSELISSMESLMDFDEEAFAEAFQISMGEDEVFDLMSSIMNPNISTYERNLALLGYADLAVPSRIHIYPKNFESKQVILDILEQYNQRMQDNGEPEKVIRFIDIVGVMMSSVTEIIDLVSYGLIAFVSISLVVSSIMIGVITFISVLERKKEIGILRAIGASKQNIRTVFNAEALIIGFVAGVLGVFITLLIVFIGNLVLFSRFDLENLAQLPVVAGFALIGVSMFLTFIAGLFPSSAAARKDPVEALRSE